MAIGFGLIGCGVIGPRLAAGANEAAGVDLVACVDVVGANAREVAEEYGCEPYTDHGEMLAAEEPDAVIVATPSGTHSSIAIDCAEAGVDVLCQKPLDVRLERVDAMIAACSRAGVTLGGVFPRRFNRASERAREAIENGELGDVVTLNAFVPKHRTHEYYDSGGWRGTREMDGGCLMNQGIHLIDLVGWLGGGIESVYAHAETVAHEIEVEDVATVNARFCKGAQGVVQATTAVYPERPERVEVHGKDGRLVLSGRTGTWSIAEFETNEGETTFEESYEIGPFGLQIQEFAEAIREGRDPAVTGEEARKAVDAILAMYESAGRDERVGVEEFLAEARGGR